MTHFTALIIALVSIIVFIRPTTFSWIRGDTQVVVFDVIMLGIGMTLGKEDYQVLAQRPFDIFIDAIAQYTIMLPLVIGIARAFNLSPGLTLGLVLVGICPGGASPNIMSFLAKGDVVFLVGMIMVSAALAPMITPLWMTYLVGQTIEMDGWGMFKFMLLTTLLPVVVGLVVNISLHKRHWFEDMHAIMPTIAVTAFTCIVGGVAAVHGHYFAESAFVMVLAIAVHNIGGYILGYYSGVLTGTNTARKRTLAVGVGVQNAGLATGLSAKFFPGNAESAVVAAVACVWYSASGMILGNLFTWWDKR